jgi:DHA3 family macrolide efflux protein-like MFS transporter
MGVPVFLADIKGDLSGMCEAGVETKHIRRSIDSMGLENFTYSACPVRFWDVYGKMGLPVRTTISEMGPELIARLLGLNDTQAGIRRIVFRVADERGLLVLTIGVSLGMLAYGPIDSLLPLMVSSHFGGDGFAASLVAAVMGAGLLVGALALMAANPQKKLAFIIVVAAFIVGAGAFVSGLIPPDGYWLFVACVGVLAIACAWFNAPLMTLLQKGIPEDKLGRVMGLFTAMNGLAIPIGTALGGAIAEVTGTPMFFTIDGAFMLALGAGIALSKSVRQLD